MQPTSSRMQYAYSTKNFHRFSAVNDGPQHAINEVYIPRSFMVRPLAEITVSVSVASAVEVAEKTKPAKASARA